MTRNTIDALAQAKAWGIDVRQARYSEWGNFYGLLTEFPAALLDAHGYYFVRTPEDLRIPGISVGKRINVPKRIEALPHYIEAEPARSPDEFLPNESVWEGAKRSVTVNVYERHRNARKTCIEHWGTTCAVCEFDFGSIYGRDFVGIIHVHHVVPVASIGESYRLDPVKDLRPVCPNCHAVIHSRSHQPPFSVDELRAILSKNATRPG